MTHDELLAKIDYDIEGNPYDEYMSALRAVVELHKPSLGKACVECSKTAFWIAYPCQTIQAIQEQLK